MSLHLSFVVSTSSFKTAALVVAYEDWCWTLLLRYARVWRMCLVFGGNESAALSILVGGGKFPSFGFRKGSQQNLSRLR